MLAEYSRLEPFSCHHPQPPLVRVAKKPVESRVYPIYKWIGTRRYVLASWETVINYNVRFCNHALLRKLSRLSGEASRAWVSEAIEHLANVSALLGRYPQKTWFRSSMWSFFFCVMKLICSVTPIACVSPARPRLLGYSGVLVFNDYCTYAVQTHLHASWNLWWLASPPIVVTLRVHTNVF